MSFRRAFIVLAACLAPTAVVSAQDARQVDIAGVDIFDREKGVIVKGASGIPVRTLVHWVLQSAEAPAGVK